MARFFILALSLGTLPAAAQDIWQQQVDAQIDAISAQYRAAGYSKISKTFHGELDEDDSAYYDLELSDRYEYIAIGVCDEDCDDLDLVIYDSAGDAIAEDVENDAVPVIAGRPDYLGRYKMEVEMVDCDSEPCSYGVTLYAR